MSQVCSRKSVFEPKGQWSTLAWIDLHTNVGSPGPTRWNKDALLYIMSCRTGKLTRRAVHARRLVQYQTFNSTTSALSNSLNVTTMLRVPHLSRDYIYPSVCGGRISNWLAAISTKVNQQQVLAHYLIHIFLCFPRLQGRWILPNTLPLPERLIFCLDNGRVWRPPHSVHRDYVSLCAWKIWTPTLT